MIVKEGNTWIVKSDTTGRVFGTYDNKDDAEKRLKQIEMFKHMKGKKRRK
jgi:hypothetical protein